jgi:hypothetical protein
MNNSSSSETNWQTIKTFANVIEAEIAKSLLDSEGIESFVRDAHTVSINMLYSNALGGIRLDVKATDAERAIELLNQTFAVEAPVCEKCGSKNVSRVSASRRIAFFSFFAFGIPLPFSRKRLVCKDCKTIQKEA